ncbi:MAG TPA: hypothetical protein VGG63_10510 [Steroidobacteraceae bacterium]|jgi:hypothetical protein
MGARSVVLAAALASALLCPLRVNALEASASVHKACPHIDPAVVSLGIGSLLPADWDKRAGAEACTDLDAIAARYAGRPVSTLPAVSDLRAIALRLQQPAAPPSSFPLWNHFKAWLRQRFAPFAGLLKWLHSLPSGNAGSGLRTSLLLGAGALILVAVTAIIFTELRAAGFFGPGRRRRSKARGSAAPARFVPAEGNPDGDEARLDRPASALRMLIEALRRSRRIERDGSLTCREVLAQAVFDTQGQRDGFASIALLAERELFGARELTIRVPDELLPILRQLYTQLLTAPAARAPA